MIKEIRYITGILMNKLGRLLLFFAIFVFIYSPIIKLGSLNLITFKLFPPALFLLSIVCLKKVSKSFLFLFITLLFVLAFSLIHYQLAFYKDSTFINRVGIGVLIMTGSFLFIHIFKVTFSDYTISKLIDYIILSGVLNAGIMIFQLFSEPFRELTNVFFEITIFDTSFGEIQRINGLASAGGAVLSVLMSLSLVLIHFKQMKLRDKNWSIFKIVFMSIFLFFGIVYSGRSGLLLIFLYFIYYYLTTFQIAMIIKYSIWGVIGVLLMLYIIDNYSDESRYLSALRRTSEIFIRLRDDGQLRTKSSDHLQNMYILPEGQLHLLLGNGNFGRQEKLPYVQSDVFYIRIIFGMGVIGLLVFITPFIVMILIILDRKSTIQGFLIFLVSVMIILNFKEVFYFGTTGFTPILCLLLASHLSPYTFREKRSSIICGIDEEI